MNLCIKPLGSRWHAWVAHTRCRRSYPESLATLSKSLICVCVWGHRVIGTLVATLVKLLYSPPVTKLWAEEEARIGSAAKHINTQASQCQAKFVYVLIIFHILLVYR
jgi:hypothetical protein